MTDMLGPEIPRYPLITPRVGPTPSDSFIISPSPGYELVTLSASGLSVGESIPVQVQAYDGTWGNASSTNPITNEEEPVELTYGANTKTLYGPGVYRVNKGITELPTSVTLFR